MKKLFFLCCAVFTLCMAKAQNSCVKTLLFDDFNSTAGWTQWGSLTSITGGTFNFLNTAGAVYDRQFKAVPGLTTYSTTIFARCKLVVKSGNGPGHHILTLFENGALDPLSLDASGGYAPTVNDAIMVDLTAKFPPTSTTSSPNPTDPTSLWQFNLRYKKGTTLFTCPTAINFPALNTPYYVQLERGGNTLKLSVFSNSSYTTHIPGSPICFTIGSALNPLGYVNLGVITAAGYQRILNGTIDSLRICQGTDIVACTPPCDTSCHLTLIAGGVSGGPFACGSTIKLNCTKTYDFNPQIKCSNGASSGVTAVTLTDPSNNTPGWAASFIAGNGNGTLAVPGGVTPGIYTLTYYFGAGGNTCDSCKYYLNIQCSPCNCTLKNSVKINGVKKNLKCADTILLACSTTNTFAPSLNCNGDITTHLSSVTIKDGLGNTPAWALSSYLFFTNLGTGNLIIPAGVSGYYTLTYNWSSSNDCKTICGSCSYVLKIQCCSIFTVSAGPDLIICGSVQLNAIASNGLAPYTYQWSPITGLSNPNIANPILTGASGSYIVTATDAGGCVKQDTVKVVPGGLACKGQQANIAPAKQVNLAGQIQAVPNPFTNGFMMEGLTTNATSIDVSTADGKSITQYENIAKGQEYGKNLQPGVYVITVHFTDGSSKTIKAIKSE